MSHKLSQLEHKNNANFIEFKFVYDFDRINLKDYTLTFKFK